MDRIIAYCGLVCTECPGYKATQANDQEALERVAAMWREEYNAPDLTVASVICDGCLGVEGRKCGHWSECEIRICAQERAVVNCGHCDDYACERVEAFFGFVPEARKTLDEVRQSLGA
jgi:hypothetical protein